MDGINAPSKREPKKLSQKSKKIINPKKENMPKQKSFLTNLISIIVTAAIVGGAVYAWQSKEKTDSLGKIQQDAKNTREGYERSLSLIDNKVKKAEDENTELKTKLEELEGKVELIKDAEKKYNNEELGISFSYPAIMGNINYEKTSSNSGEKFVSRFSLNNNFHFAGVSSSFSEDENASSTEVNFDNFMKLEKERNDYFATFSKDAELFRYRVNPAEVIALNGGEALLVDKNSFVIENDLPQVGIGQNVGAIMSTKKENFAGIAFLNSDFGQLPLESFKNLLKNIEIK